METNEIQAIGGSFLATIAYLVLAVMQPATATLYIGFAILFAVLFVISIGATALSHYSR